MPFESVGDEPLDATVNVRLTTAEKYQLREDAELAGLSLSALIRRRYFGRPIIADTDLTMIRELRRLGGLFKHLHASTSGAHSAQMTTVIRDIGDAITRLAR